MIKRFIFVFLIFNISFAHTMTEIDKEVANFQQKLSLSWEKAQGIQRTNLSPETETALIDMCKKNIQLTSQNQPTQTPTKKCRNRTKKKKKSASLPTAPHLEELNVIYKKIKKYQKYDNLPKDIRAACEKALNGFHENVLPLIKYKFIHKKNLIVIEKIKQLSQMTLDMIQVAIKKETRDRFHALKKIHLQLRQKTSGSEIKQYMGQCTCSKKNTVISHCTHK